MSVQLFNGDCMEVMRGIPDNSVDSIITDPPYELGFMGKAWDSTGIANNVTMWQECFRILKPGGHLLSFGGSRTYHRMTCAVEDASFEIRDCIMWVYAQGFPKSLDVAWNLHQKAAETCGIMVPYDNGTEKGIGQNSQHKMRFVRASYLQTAVYACAQCGQVLQPFVSKQETQILRQTWSESETCWPEKSRLERRSYLEATEGELQRCEVCTLSSGIFADGSERQICDGTSFSDGPIPWEIVNQDGSRTSYRPQSVEQLSCQFDAFQIERRAQEIRGFGTALKPAHEPIVMARKPLVGTVVANVLQHGTGAINIAGCRVGTESVTQRRTAQIGWRANEGRTDIPASADNSVTTTEGRWPANLIHDGSNEVLGLFPESVSRTSDRGLRHSGKHGGICDGGNLKEGTSGIRGHNDSGSAARFFYCAKTSKSDRNDGLTLPAVTSGEMTDRADGSQGLNSPRAGAGSPSGSSNFHPTVKPTELMRYLCRLVTPPGGRVMDPMMGSGSTGKAAVVEGFGFVGIEREPPYFAICQERIAAAEFEWAMSAAGEL